MGNVKVMLKNGQKWHFVVSKWVACIEYYILYILLGILFTVNFKWSCFAGGISIELRFATPVQFHELVSRMEVREEATRGLSFMRIRLKHLITT